MLIEIENLVKRYGDFTALNHLNLAVKKGDILGLLGPNDQLHVVVIDL